MKFRYALTSVGTNGSGRYGDTVTDVEALIISHEDKLVPQVNGTVKLQFRGDQMARFGALMKDRHGFSEPFDIPLPGDPPLRYRGPKRIWPVVDVMLVGLRMLLSTGWIDANTVISRLDEILRYVRTGSTDLEPPKNGLRVTTLSCGHDVWASDAKRIGEKAPCEACHSFNVIVALR